MLTRCPALPLPVAAPRQLFPVIDTNHDGVISLEELQRHLYENGQAISWRRAQVEFNDTDTNGDGKVGMGARCRQALTHRAASCDRPSQTRTALQGCCL